MKYFVECWVEFFLSKSQAKLLVACERNLGPTRNDKRQASRAWDLERSWTPIERVHQPVMSPVLDGLQHCYCILARDSRSQPHHLSYDLQSMGLVAMKSSGVNRCLLSSSCCSYSPCVPLPLVYYCTSTRRRLYLQSQAFDLSPFVLSQSSSPSSPSHRHRSLKGHLSCILS